MIEDILTLARVRQEENPRWRWGQCVFNAAYEICPNKANLYRGGNGDCFYNDSRVDSFLADIDSITEFDNHFIADQDIADLLVTAFEGGINYWCGEVTVHIPPSENYNEDEDYMSDLLHHGGELKLTDIEDPYDAWILTKDKFIEGLKRVLKENNWTVEDLMDYQDADVVDQIIQYALFNEIVFC